MPSVAELIMWWRQDRIEAARSNIRELWLRYTDPRPEERIPLSDWHRQELRMLRANIDDLLSLDDEAGEVEQHKEAAE